MPKQTTEPIIRRIRLQTQSQAETTKPRQESVSMNVSETFTAQPDIPAESSNAAISRGPELPTPVAYISGETGLELGVIKPRLAESLSARQLLHQRLQKYKLSAIFHADVVGPGQDQRWRGSFWIKGTLLGTSNFERTKSAAKEGAALEALKWLNMNHYY